MADTWRDEEYVCEGKGVGALAGFNKRLVSNAVVWRLVWTRATSPLSHPMKT